MYWALYVIGWAIIFAVTTVNPYINSTALDVLFDVMVGWSVLGTAKWFLFRWICHHFAAQA